MKDELLNEIQRLTVSAARRREDLQLTGLRKAKRKKQLTIFAGILALTSAGAITTVISNVFGTTGLQLVAALTAAVSGTISLFITAYYSDDAVVTMLQGSAEYLALRENVYRLVIHPNMSDADRFARLEELQDEYAKLDKYYSRYFSVSEEHYTSAPPVRSADRAIAQSVLAADRRERENLEREFRNLKNSDAT